MSGRVSQRLGVLLCLVLLALVSACASSSEDGADGADGRDGQGTGDTSPGKLLDVGDQASAPEASDEEPEQRTLPDGPEDGVDDEDDVRLEPLDQPDNEFPDPELPEEPAEDSDELTHLVFLIQRSAWEAAGMVDDDTETECTIDESKLAQPGEYDFGCTVSFAGAEVEYDVSAEVKDKKVPTEFETEKLPVSEQKAVHEATRQSFEPARVTCDIVGVETVRVGKEDGFTCWVTDVDNDRTTYDGEVLKNGQLQLRQQ